MRLSVTSGKARGIVHDQARGIDHLRASCAVARGFDQLNTLCVFTYDTIRVRSCANSIVCARTRPLYAA